MTADTNTPVLHCLCRCLSQRTILFITQVSLFGKLCFSKSISDCCTSSYIGSRQSKRCV